MSSGGRSADEIRADSRPVVIVGAGENADIAYEYFTQDSLRDVVAFSVERAYVSEQEHAGLPVVALEEVAERFRPEEVDVHVAISSQQLNRLRERLFTSVRDMGYACASFVSPHAFVWHNVPIGENVFVFEQNVLQHHVSVGDNVVLWSGNHVGHRSTIGDHCFVSSHVVISGYCTVGSHCFLGVNASVGDGVTIGADAVVGAGAVVVKDLAPRGVYVGNPAKPTGRDSFEAFKVPGG